MHKIISSDLLRGDRPFIGEDEIRTIGHLIAIEPPVNLNPAIVERAITAGNLGNTKYDSRENPFAEVALVGSTSDRTVIYARLFSEALNGVQAEESRELLIHRTRELLGILGVNGVEYDREAAPMSRILL